MCAILIINNIAIVLDICFFFAPLDTKCIFCNLMFHMRLIAQLYASISGNIGKGKREAYKGGNRCIFLNSLGSRVQTLQNIYILRILRILRCILSV